MSSNNKDKDELLKECEKIKDKYIKMAANRNDFNNIDVSNFMLPDMNEMVQEDLMSEIYQQFLNGDTDDKYQATEKEQLDRFFYIESPFTTSPGHYTEEGAFVLRATRANIDKTGSTWDLNKFDGDTWNFALKDIDDGGEAVMFTNNTHSVKYKNFKDFYKKMGGGEAIQVRALGINAAELPHYEVQAIPSEKAKNRIIEVTFKKLKEMVNGKTTILYQKCPRDEKGNFYTRKDTDIVKLLEVETDDPSTKQYTEIISRINAEKYINKKKPGFEYYTILGQKDDSNPNTILDAIAAQKASKDVLENSSEIVLVLNANGIKADQKVDMSAKSFNNIYYFNDMVKYLVKEWDIYYGDLPITNYSYIPYGMDNYKRSLGVVYAKYKGEWINLNKYVLCKTEHTVANPKFNDSPELQEIGAGISESFNLWSYDRNNIEWLDSFNKIAGKAYEEKLKLHKEITGIDFAKVRNCALFIGDTLMLIPPESIKNVTQVSYEKVPNIRSKGTQAKQKGHNEHRLEISLYFYEDVGINGIPYTYTTPNGTVFEYKMNGLRSLIAQFKVAPFLPIENGYINDVLGIEAVALENMNIQTVDGFPRLLKVVLTLKEFNYRVFMPDMPIDDNKDDEKERLSEQNPMFAKSFNWEIFRYYYQRAIIAGDRLSLLKFASYEYNLEYYGNKNAIGSWWFQCGPKLNKGTISFYIPDENWLANALQVKKDRDEKLLTPTSSIDLSDEARAFVKSLSELALNADKIQKYESEEMNTAIDNLIGRAVRGEHRLGVSIPFFLGEKKKIEENIVNTGLTKVVLYTKANEDSWVDIPQSGIDLSLVKSYVAPMQKAMTGMLSDPKIVKDVTTNEILWKDENDIVHVIWEFSVKLNLESISNEDWSNVKEVLGKDIEAKPNEIFINDSYKIGYEMTFIDKWDLATNIRLNPLVISDDASSKHFENTFILKKSKDIEALANLIKDIDKEDNPLENLPDDSASNKYNKEIDYYVKDYKNPANMPFVPYVEDVLCQSAMSNLSNSFTEISLKAIEGQGPQYMGGQDTQLEFQLITDDTSIVTALNTLPTLASAMAKRYRKILPAWPIKIKSDITNMLGVSEVLIDLIEVSTVEGVPGVYSIIMRLTSVDRTQRQREALRRLDVKPEGGDVDSHTSSNLSMKNYFNINNSLSKVELYPDLDLPTLKELGKLGFRFVKYAGQFRSYPDPDFYILYAYPYSSLIIKKMVKDVLSKNLLNDKQVDPTHFYKFKDIMGAEITGKIEAYMGVSVDSLDNEKAKTYFDIMKSLEESIAEKLSNFPNLSEENKKEIQDKLEITTAIKKLVLADVSDGWEIRPGWKAPLADVYVNDAISTLTQNQENAFAQEIKDRRIECIKIIDSMLSKPIKTRSMDTNLLKRNDNYRKVCVQLTNEIFGEGEGKKLIETLCPGVPMTKLSESFNLLKNFNLSNPLSYIAGYLFSSGCALSGNREFASKIDEREWYPNQYMSSSEYPEKDTSDTEYKGNFLPYCVSDKIAGSTKYALSIKEGIETGTVFGAWRIVKYSDPEIISKMLNKQSNITYISEKDSPYKDATKAGFIDPYYNKLEDDNKEIYEYKKSILTSIASNAEAFIRNVLVHLRKMIVDGYLISELDIVAQDWNKLFYDVLGNKEKIIEDNTGGDTAIGYTWQPLIDAVKGSPPEMVKHEEKEVKVGSYTEMAKYVKEVKQSPENVKTVSAGLEALGMKEDEIKKLMYHIQQSSRKAFCARLIYPFISAVTKNSPDLYTLFEKRDYQTLDSLTGYVESATGLSETRVLAIKFLSAMSGINMSLQQEGKNEAVASESQRLMNSIMKDIFIKASEDTRAYVLHSFYDMLVNDKRGRLVRAFPTYYVVFVDEGRKYGSWKLHDNFYNMNSISSINVVKSRKIAADTCTLVMNNTFNSYTMEPDSTTTQQYADIYGLRDVFDSIFSPKAYFDKEKRIRMRKNIPDTVLLQPGIRIHVRIGYSADGSKLPIVFNGKVAEVEINEVAQIIAQGDGHELTNPLSAFGEIDAVSLDAAQTPITWFKDLRGNWSKGGESPRNLLAKVLTAKYGGWKKVVDDISDGRWFNENPFGLMHFGDPKFRNIFEQGEVVQNLYEVSDEDLLKGVNDFEIKTTKQKMTPILNVAMQDKTFWDLLHLSANSGINYIGAVRDFGFRSTIFLGKPNHYYAYEYVLIDGKVVEKRKPFQQFHYYDSYTDIVYNSIKASEAQMKTNAVGMWQASSPWWGREQATVGPIYLDMNIYPEYQRTMTVDTGLLAAGDGGIDIPVFNHFSESWAMDPNDNKVNKSTAWRVTANALKNSVKDMYLGDLGIMGDPSVKPYDRVYLHDTYEDMMGMFEVEAVIHNMSAETGFTTSIMPDVIARHNDKTEAANQALFANVGAFTALTVGSVMVDKLWATAIHGKLSRTIAKSKEMYGKTEKLSKMAKDFYNTAGMSEFLENKPTAKMLFENLNVLPKASDLGLEGIDNSIDFLKKLAKEDLKNPKTLSEALYHYSRIDIDKYEKALKTALKNDKYGLASADLDADALEEVIKGIKDAKLELNKSIDISKLNLKEFAEEILKVDQDGKSLESFLDKGAKKAINRWKTGEKIEDTNKILRELSDVLKDENIIKAIKEEKIKTSHIDSFVKGFSEIFDLVDDGKKMSKFAKLSNALKGNKILGMLKNVAKGVLKFNWATLLIDFAIETVFVIITKNAQEVFTRFLQGIQAVDVYPLKKNNKPLIAGMNGQKGSVHGFPVKDGYDSIQGMVKQFTDSFKNFDGDLPVMDWILEQFVDKGVLDSLSKEWRVEVFGEDEEEKTDEDLLQEVYNNISSTYAADNKQSYSMMIKPRINKPSKDDHSPKLLGKYSVTGQSVMSLTHNPKILALNTLTNRPNIKEAILNKRFNIAHSDKPDGAINIAFESGVSAVPYKVQDGIIDLPLIRDELIWLLESLLRDEALKKHEITFKSGIRVNDEKGLWRSTGFSMVIEVSKGNTDVFQKTLDKYINQTNILKDRDGVFSYNKDGDKFNILALAPTDETVKENSK